MKPGHEAAHEHQHQEQIVQHVGTQFPEPGDGYRAVSRGQPLSGGRVLQLAPHHVDGGESGHDLEQAGDQHQAHTAGVVDRGIEEQAGIHPDRRPQRRSIEGTADIGGDEVARGEVLLIVEEGDPGRAPAQHIPLEVARDDQYRIDLALHQQVLRLTQVLHSRDDVHGPGSTHPACRLTRGFGRVEVEHPDGELPGHLRLKNAGQQEAGGKRDRPEQGPEHGELRQPPKLAADHASETAHPDALERRAAGQSISALMPGRIPSSGRRGRARTSKVRTSKPPDSRVARQVAKEPSGET